MSIANVNCLNVTVMTQCYKHFACFCVHLVWYASFNSFMYALCDHEIKFMKKSSWDLFEMDCFRTDVGWPRAELFFVPFNSSFWVKAFTARAKNFALPIPLVPFTDKSFFTFIYSFDVFQINAPFFYRVKSTCLFCLWKLHSSTDLFVGLMFPNNMTFQLSLHLSAKNAGSCWFFLLLFFWGRFWWRLPWWLQWRVSSRLSSSIFTLFKVSSLVNDFIFISILPNLFISAMTPFRSIFFFKVESR